MAAPILRARRDLIRLKKLAWYDAMGLTEGALVSWPDSSGKGFHTAQQGTGTARPTVTAAQYNGKKGVVFDGGDRLQLPSALFNVPNGPNTLIVLAKQATASGALERIIDMTEAGAARWNMQYSAAANNIAFNSANGGSGVAMAGVTTTNPNILVGRRLGTTRAVSINGGAETTDTNGSDESGINSGTIGGISGSSLTGTIFEIRIYDQYLSDGALRAELSDIAQRWGGPALS